MAVKKIELENFKGRTASYELGRANTISGRNGAGKSSIRDALAFVFCGTDSVGTRNPTHLISKDSDGMKVSVVTGKATITRSLSRKGNGTIKVEQNGVASTYNQSQFENMVGRVDTFLSAMIPGYLFDLTEAKRQEVLADVLPKVDRLAILVELLGFEPSPEEKLKYGFNRRPDLVAAGIATDRRGAEAALNQKRGRIAQLSELTKPEEPALVDVSSELSAMAHLKAQWSEHEAHLKDSSARKLRRMQVIQENSFRDQRRKEIAQQLEELKLKPKSEYEPISLEDLRAQIKPLPSQPVMAAELDSDHCSTCGQAVSLKSRSAVRLRNEEINTSWKKECEQTEEHNKGIQSQIKAANDKNEAAKKAYLETVEHNRRVESIRKSLEIELAGLTDQEVPEEILSREAPESVYSASAHMALVEKQETYKKAMAIYESRMEDWKSMEQQVKNLSEEVSSIQGTVDRFKAIEVALKSLPEVETKRQIGVFNTEQIIFDGNDCFVNGTPRKMLSTGERAKTDVYFCREIMLRMPKPHGLVFHDDADLVSACNWEVITGGKAWDSSKFQDFIVYVSEEDLKVEIKEAL
jgi:hypothetical protein